MSGEHVCILTPSMPRIPGGGARVYIEHANQLCRRGYHVSIVFPLGLRPGLPGRALDLARNKVRDLKVRSLRRGINWMRLDPSIDIVYADQLDDDMPLPEADVYVGTYWRTSEVLGARTDRLAKAMQLIQGYETWAGPKDRVDATWRLPIHSALVSQSLLRKGAELGVAPERLHVAPNGIDHETYRVTVPIDHRRACIAFLAHEPPVKGLPDALETIRQVRAQAPDIEVLAFGGAARPSSLPSDIPYLRRPVGTELVDKVYNRATIYLCASLSEGFGFPSLEAMACGAALVSTANGGVDDFAVDGESALIRPVGEPGELADAILSLLADEDRRQQVVRGGLASASRFTWEAAGAGFHQALLATLGRPVST